jgi:hypothetical protein
MPEKWKQIWDKRVKAEQAASERAASESAGPVGSLCCDALVLLSRRPWVASDQYGMRMILSQDNKIVIRADHLPLEMLRAMAQAANTWQENTQDQPAAGLAQPKQST